MDVRSFDIPEVVVITPARFADARGWFSETYNAAAFEAATGCVPAFMQDNTAFSVERGTLRGLHGQAPPFDQAKLVQVVRGRVFDVAVDVRVGSPSYGRWAGVELSADRGEQIFVPRGFLHGYVTLEENTLVTYKVDNRYARDHETGLLWSDPDLAIAWPIPTSQVILSDRDRMLPPLSAYRSPFAV